MAWSPLPDSKFEDDGPNRLIIGAGGHGRECIGLWRRSLSTRGLDADSRSWVREFVDDRLPDQAVLARLGATWIGSIEHATQIQRSPVEYVLGVGSGGARCAMEAAVPPLWKAAVAVDPKASIDDDLLMCDGVLVFAQATVTTNVILGRHTHVGRGAAIGHDCRLGDYVTVMPLASVSGNVVIGDRATIGSGAVVRQGQRIGDDAYVGAGAVVVSDVAAGLTVVGNPARAISPGARY